MSLKSVWFEPVAILKQFLQLILARQSLHMSTVSGTFKDKDFGLPPCSDMFSVIFCFLVYAFYVIPLGESAGGPMEWFGSISCGKMLLSATNFLLHLSYYFIKANLCLFCRKNQILDIQCSSISRWPSVHLCCWWEAAKERLKSSGNILRNSMARHLLFTLCTPSVPSPGKGFQISPGNPSQNLQHILVPDASHSRILKTITQTTKDPEVELCTVPKCDGAVGASWNCQITPEPLSCGWLYHSLFTMRIKGLITLFQVDIPLFPAFLKALSILTWSQI